MKMSISWFFEDMLEKLRLKLLFEMIKNWTFRYFMSNLSSYNAKILAAFDVFQKWNLSVRVCMWRVKGTVVAAYSGSLHVGLCVVS